MGFKEDIERLRQYMDDDGELATIADSLEASFEASPLRADNKKLKADLETAITKAQKSHEFAVASAFKEVGIKVKPDALKLPDDFDPTDTQSVKAWAIEAGFIEAEPDTPPGEVKAHEAMQQAVAGGEVVPKVNPTDDLDPTKLSEEEFWAKAKELNVAK